MREIRDGLRRRPAFFLFLILLPIYLIIGLFLLEKPEPSFEKNREICVSGRISEKKTDDDNYVEMIGIRGKHGQICYLGNLKEMSGSLPLGSVVEVIGKPSSFDNPSTPGVFNQYKYYKVKGYDYYLNASSLKIIKTPVIPFNNYLYELRSAFCMRVLRYCPIEGGTINTLLFGDKTNLDPDRKRLFKLSGLSHFLVISGLHVSVTGGGLYFLLKKLGLKRNIAAFFGIVIIVIYGFLVGFSISVFRAVMMYLIRLSADILERSYDTLTALSISAVLTLSVNPMFLFDSAFIYSYGAVLSLGLCSTYIKANKYMPIILLYLSLLPVTLYFQSYSNVLSVFLNILLGIFTLPILSCAAIAFAASLVGFLPIAALFDFFCGVMLRFIDSLSNLISGLDCFKIVYKPSLLMIFIYYFIFAILIFTINKGLPKWACFIVMLTAIIFIGTNPDPSLYMHVIDVGQGDCIFVQTGPHKGFLSDCGSTSKSNIAQNVVVPYLMSQGITTLEDVYLSHEDSDHINGIDYLLSEENKDVSVRRVLYPPNFNYEMINNASCETRSIERNATANYGKVAVRCLNPDGKKLFDDSNSDSLVLWINYGDFDALLTGDSTTDTEENLTLPLIHFEVLKVAHHGSKTSTGIDFLKQVNPDTAIISVGKRNRYGHPSPEVINRMEDMHISIFRTDQNGTVKIRMN